MIVPELELIRQGYMEIKTAQELTNKRLDDMNAQLVDQSRRIDDTNKRIAETRVELKGEIASTRAELMDEIKALNQRIDKTDAKVDSIHTDLIARIDETNRHVNEVALGLGRLYEVIVRREEHKELKEKVEKISQQIGL